MGRLIQLTALRESIRLRYDLGSFAASGTWTSTAAVNAQINASLQSFYGMLIDCSGDEYFGTVTDITTTANVDLTSLPARFLRLHDLTWLRDTDDPIQLRPAETRDAVMSGLTSQDWDVYRPVYRLQGMNAIRWLPTPKAVYTVRCTYSALPADLVNDTDTFDAGPEWDEWVINDVCRKFAQREQSGDITSFIQERDRIAMRIREQAPIRTDANNTGLLLAEPMIGYEDGVGDWQLRELVTRY
jgi:hypothetical protein